jgi:transcriptional regulator with PAS, ATPase and Fis domain
MENLNINIPKKSIRYAKKPQKTAKAGLNPEMEFLYTHFNRASETLAKSYIIMNCSKKSIPLKKLMDNLEKLIIDSALQVSCGSQKKAAAILGVKQTSLCEKIKKLKIVKRKKSSRYLVPEISDF